MPARAAPPELPGFRFTTFGGSTAGIEGVFGRIYNPPLHARATISCCRGVQNTYSLLPSLTQKNRLAFASRFFLCWRYLSSCVGKVLSRRRRDQKLFVVHINEQRLAGDKSLFSCWRYLSSRAVTRKVLSAKVSLTSVFGMGTGGPSPQSTPTSSRQIPYPSPRSKAQGSVIPLSLLSMQNRFCIGFQYCTAKMW